MQYDIHHINKIVQGDLIANGNSTRINHLLTDSRKLIFPAETLFFALSTSRRDGHQFVPALYESGVRNFVVSKHPGSKSPQDANFIIVRNTLQALQALARAHRQRFQIPVIGITGSNGKTVVKEWLSQLLGDDYLLARSPGSYNSQIGVALSLWLLHSKHQLGIFEAGISRSGEMKSLQAMIVPTIGILTNIGEAHAEGFRNREEKLSEKLLLFQQSEIVIFHESENLTQDQIRPYLSSSTKLLSWGSGENAALRILHTQRELTQTIIDASWGSERFEIAFPFIDNASIENALHCCCILLHLGYHVDEIRKRIVNLRPVAMRLELKTGIHNSSVINDSYSADLSSLKIALDFLSQQKQHEKRSVILSDILESGKAGEQLYTEVASLLSQHRVNRLIGIGPEITANAKYFAVKGLTSSFYTSVRDFRADFQKIPFHDETILIKGARVFEFEGIDRLLQQKVHQTVLEIDLNALVNNLNVYRKLLPPSTKIMAMVKAFSYGSGSFEIANILEFHKADYLCVAYADEGVALRTAGIRLPIMVLNTDEAGFPAIVTHRLEPDLYSKEVFTLFNEYLESENITDYPVHLELETGMNRLGITEEDMSYILPNLKGSRFKVQSILSHLAASEDPAMDEFTSMQGERFTSMYKRIEGVLGYQVLKHIANSSGSSRHPALRFDMVRIGIGLYGFDPGIGLSEGLKEVPRLKSTVAQVKRLSADETVGYGRKGTLNRPSLVATVRIGYADGYIRRLGNGKGKMLIRGRLAPVIGSVCMDMTMVDVTDIGNVAVGDEVIVFGPELSVKELAAWAETIPYEILTGISQRVKRVYFEE